VKVAIVGGSGFIGSELSKIYKNPIIIDSKNFDLQKIKNCDIVINLAGKPITKRWNKNYKKLLYSSRIDTTKKIVEIINESNVKHFISTSAIGYYKNPCICNEDSENGNSFLAKLAKDWEEEAKKCNKLTTIFRLPVVLGNGGALGKMLNPFKFGLGAKIGDAKQMFSWIDIKDLINIYQFVIKYQIDGILNISSPNSVTNLEFTNTLAKVLGTKAIFTIPKGILRFIFGEASEIFLANQDMKPKRLLELGYNFKYEDLEYSLKSIIKGI
jgi:uncharacterized protein (TIGR01777 family)